MHNDFEPVEKMFIHFRILKDLPEAHDNDPYTLGRFVIQGYWEESEGEQPLLLANGIILPACQGFYFLADGESAELSALAGEFSGPDTAVDPAYRADLGDYALVLTRLWVDKAYRRKGVASAFLDKLPLIATSICPGWTGIYLLADPYETDSRPDPCAFDYDIYACENPSPDRQAIVGMFRKHGFRQKTKARGEWVPMWLVNSDFNLR